MTSKNEQRAARHACGIALAVLGFAAHADVDAPATAAQPAVQAEQVEVQPAAEAAATAPAASAPQTRLRFHRGSYKPGIEKLRVVRREDTVGNVAGQIALNVALAVLAGGVAVRGVSKDELGGATL